MVTRKGTAMSSDPDTTMMKTVCFILAIVLGYAAWAGWKRDHEFDLVTISLAVGFLVTGTRWVSLMNK